MGSAKELGPKILELPEAVSPGAGRPLTSEAVFDAIVAAVDRGVPVQAATVAAGRDKGIMREWRAVVEYGRWPDGQPARTQTREQLIRFFQRLEVAKANFQDKAVQRILAIGEGDGDPKARKDWKAYGFVLQNSADHREDFFEHRPWKGVLRVEGTVEHRIVRQLSDGQLIELLPSEFQALTSPVESGEVGSEDVGPDPEASA